MADLVSDSDDEIEITDEKPSVKELSTTDEIEEVSVSCRKRPIESVDANDEKVANNSISNSHKRTKIELTPEEQKVQDQWRRFGRYATMVPEPDMVREPDDPNVISSPIRLLNIPEMPDSENIDTVSLGGILNKNGDLRYMWQINFSIELTYIMACIDVGIRKRLQSYFITGKSTRSDVGSNYNYCVSQLSEIPDGPQVQVCGVDMYNPFGSHHTKMMILGFSDNPSICKSHDEIKEIQVVIHTANLTPFDWT